MSATRMRAAAFGATPGADAFAAAADPDPLVRWLGAVVLGGQGRYAAAAAVLHGLLARSRPLVASLAASTLASHRRQLGAHAAAMRLDAEALRRCADPWPPDRTAGHARRQRDDVPGGPEPDGIDRAGARCDALVGLAADAIGLGRVAAAGRLVAAAGVAAGPSPSWRLAVRLSWVRAELLLAAGRPLAAVAPARLAVSRSAGAVRHEVKSRLVLAAALFAAGDREPAGELLHDVARSAARHGLVPLRWPAEYLLAELSGATGGGELHRLAASTALRVALRRADVALKAAAESSLWVPSGVLLAGDSAERSSAGEIHGEICTGLCQVSTPRDR